MLVVSRILAVFFLLIATIRLSRLSDAIAFQPSGIYKNRLGVYPQRWLYLLCICRNIYTADRYTAIYRVANNINCSGIYSPRLH